MQYLLSALKDFGTKEFSNGSNPHINEYYRYAGLSESTDEVPWCAAFVNYHLETSGIKGTSSGLAFSFDSYGVGIDTPVMGSIVTLKQSHVGFVVSVDNEKVYLLGGNQSDAVNITGYPRKSIKSIRMPPSVVTMATEEIFDKALTQLFKWDRKVFVNDPDDSGGPTYAGITLTRYLEFNPSGSVADLQRGLSDETLKTIYHKLYWLPTSCDKLPPALAFFHFDAGVLQGQNASPSMLQEALGVDVDGEIGPITLNAANREPLKQVIDNYYNIRKKRLENARNAPKYLNGWMNRLNDLYRETINLLQVKGEQMPEVTSPTVADPMDRLSMLLTRLENVVARLERVGQVTPTPVPAPTVPPVVNPTPTIPQLPFQLPTNSLPVSPLVSIGLALLPALLQELQGHRR